MNSFTLPSSIFPNASRPVPTDLFIGGQWRESETKRRANVFDPSTEQVITSVADCSAAEGIAAVDAAEKAAAAWAATAPRVRSEILRKCFEKIVEHVDWLAQLISFENGKALPDARGEVLYAAEFFRWYAEQGVRMLGEINTSPSGANRIVVQYEPIGISLLITPWNFPAAMATRKIAPALAAGCTCILKPATETPLTAFAIAQIMHDAGVPAGVVNVVTTTDAGALSRAVLNDDRVRKLSFTGSTEVGRILLRAAADKIISCSMELGGNAPFVVFDDANLTDALDGAMIAKMRNGGEACTAANRFYVQKGIYKSFTDGIVDRMSKVQLGAGYAPETGLGPMINAEAVQKISGLVEDALKRGAKLLLGGTTLNRPGYFYPPTVIADIQPGSEILREEIFGPVVALSSFESQEDAIRLANDTEYGLSAYIYTSDLKRGLQVCNRIESGMIALNRGLVSDPAAPFGGVKQSGLGREGSHHGLLEFAEAKYVAVSW
jgi:succinate-semialdehyde dehydrogenase / glutarate-semialdehyde dehydrogenase